MHAREKDIYRTASETIRMRTRLGTAGGTTLVAIKKRVFSLELEFNIGNYQASLSSVAVCLGNVPIIACDHDERKITMSSLHRHVVRFAPDALHATVFGDDPVGVFARFQVTADSQDRFLKILNQKL